MCLISTNVDIEYSFTYGLGYFCSPNISETTLYSFSVDQVQNHTLQSNVCMHSEELDIV